MTIRSLGVLALALLVGPSLQQLPNPINDFCRRFGHATAIVDDRLYIDGGLVNWNPITEHPVNYTNTYLLYDDLSQTVNGFPPLFANLSKNASIPDVSGGILWQDDVNKVFYQYGGEFQSTPGDMSLWCYDTIYNQWNQTLLTDNSIRRVAWGAGVAVNEVGIGYYYGGWLSNMTDPTWGNTPQMMNSLLQYDMDQNLWINSTGPDEQGRAEGVMVYLPASNGGLLIYFGGIVDPYGNGTIKGSPMSTIFIYDMKSSEWYSQTASGDVPGNRRRFCAGAAWPDDQSSYNIYLYGGAGIAPDTAGYDDVYILSLPSFTWIKWWPNQPGPGNPHNSLTCNVINNSQMLIMGGTFPTRDICDAPDVWGMHLLMLGENGPLNTMWDFYYPNITEYVVPPAVISGIGGGPNGAATSIKPAQWDNRDLSVYFARQAKFSTRTPTRIVPTGTPQPNPSSDSLRTNEIIGATVGSAAAAVLILVAIWFCYRRRKNALPKVILPEPQKPVELPVDQMPGYEKSLHPNDVDKTARLSGDLTKRVVSYTPPALLPREYSGAAIGHMSRESANFVPTKASQFFGFPAAYEQKPSPEPRHGQSPAHSPRPQAGFLAPQGGHVLGQNPSLISHTPSTSPSSHYSVSPPKPSYLSTDQTSAAHIAEPQLYNPSLFPLHAQHFPPPRTPQQQSHTAIQTNNIGRKSTSSPDRAPPGRDGPQNSAEDK